MIVAIINLNIKVIPDTKRFFFLMSYSGMIKRQPSSTVLMGWSQLDDSRVSSVQDTSTRVYQFSSFNQKGEETPTLCEITNKKILRHCGSGDVKIFFSR